jgi:hypothetical protein
MQHLLLGLDFCTADAVGVGCGARCAGRGHWTPVRPSRRWSSLAGSAGSESADPVTVIPGLENRALNWTSGASARRVGNGSNQDGRAG